MLEIIQFSELVEQAVKYGCVAAEDPFETGSRQYEPILLRGFCDPSMVIPKVAKEVHLTVAFFEHQHNRVVFFTVLVTCRYLWL